MSEDGCRASVSKSIATARICTLGTSGILKMPVKQHSAALAAEKEIAEPPKNAQTSLWHLTPAAPLATQTHPQRMSHVCTQSTAVLRRTGRASYPTTRTTNKLGPKMLATGGPAGRGNVHPYNTPDVKDAFDKSPSAFLSKVQLQSMSKAAVLVAAPVHWKN